MTSARNKRTHVLLFFDVRLHIWFFSSALAEAAIAFKRLGSTTTTTTTTATTTTTNKQTKKDNNVSVETREVSDSPE